ncbi:phage tail tape measure protein [Brenneria alni]|uniref:Phage tail tape measure protein n=1 Tax=Brenneria alni TaxID=71656 RepID=A0A421DQE1_9GAMM|nr:phage tail tape measure protein [Brenneria alni]RLM25330.1 phage tail tape measure protein [Brenneria alni]
MVTESSIGGTVSGALRSAFSGVPGTLESISETTRRLQQRQNDLTKAMERYGQVGLYGNRRLNSELQRVGRTMEQLQRQRNRLSTAANAGDALQARRSALLDQKEQTYASAQTVAAPVIGAVVKYAGFEAGLRDIAVMGNLDSAQEQKIETLIRQTALKVNQTQEALLGGVGQLINDGIKPEKALQLTGLLGKTATATQTDMTDLAKMTFAFSETLKITDTKELEQAFNVAASGAKLGSFKLKEMPKALPGLAEAFAAQGITGQQAVTQIVASLSVAKGGGSTDSAVSNMTSWLSVMNSNDTRMKYEASGIDYEKSMQNYIAGGFSQYEASLMIADRFIGDKGEAFLQPFQAAGAKGDTAAQQKLMASFGLSEVFTDTRSVNHLLSMRQNWGKYQSNKQTMTSPDAQNTLDTDFASQNDTLAARWQRMQIALNEVEIGVGKSLRPTLISLSDAIIPIIDQAGRWIAANPEIVSGIVLTVVGFKAFSDVAVTTRLVLVNLLSPLVKLWEGAMLLRSKWLLLRAAFGAGGRARQWLGLFARLGRGALSLGRLLGGVLVRGIMLVGRAAMIMGRALLMTPIGLFITAFAVGAYLVYRYWGPIGNWFKARWNDIRTAFSGGIGGVSRLIINWSPLGLFYKVFAGVMKYFGIDMPNKFTEFGGNIISGLVNGIRNKWEAAKASVSELGDNVSRWFANKLKINSPSRVFIGFGDNIAQGAAIGISRTTPQAAQAGLQLAQALIPAAPKIKPLLLSLNARPTAKALPEIPALPAGAENTVIGRRAGRQAANASGGIAVTFSPNIYMEGKKSPATPDIASALNLSLHELEKMLARIMTQQQRRGYA